ncbi:hypothetical protein PMAYCL1PPCAC_25164 [Pristionchus mayeri]|uniref:Protein polybromo-1 n=1 Tax=Pristionchus mayeri TaxID=1317129 RepID=A0AAN5D3I7_9BILA|nr:hypothetical protein PMAYCL1PPCAC_25164 [Pristionchus mayeri]
MSTKRKRVSESPIVEAKTPASSKRRRGANNNQDRAIEQLRQCQELLDYLKTVKHDGKNVLEHFMRNPSKRSDPEYYKEVENPIDVTRIQQRLRNEDYSQMSQFFEDMTLLVENALAYYKEDSEEHAHATELERIVEEKKRLIENGEEWKLNGDAKVKKELMDEETRSASPSARSAGTRSSTGDASIDEAVAEDILATIIEAADEHKRLISPPFRLLQSPEEFPLYYEKISMPIDLKTIAEKTRAGCYTNMAALEADIKLLVNNAKVFNEPGSTIHTDADTIMKVFTKKKNDSGHGRGISNKRREHCREVVDALIAQSSSEEVDEAYSEDSEEDEDLASSSEWGWQLYWAVRNEQAEGSDENLVSDPFVELPSKRYYPDYYDEIKCPMSLFMMNKKLKMGKYGSLDELVKDFALVFGNAMEYNVEASDIYKAARALKELTLKKAKQLQPSFNVQRWANFRPPTQDNTEAEVKMVASTPAAPARTPKTPKGQLRVKEEPMDEDIASESSQNTPPPTKKKMNRMKPISTGFTPLPGCKPGRKSMDELMLRFRMKLLHFWNLVYDYKDASDGGSSSSSKKKGGASSSLEDAYWPAGAFVDLPDRRQWKEYYDVINNPISLSMIKERIETNVYESSTALLADFHIMFKNAKTFNEPGSDLHRDATRLEKMVNDAHSAIPDAPYDSPLVLKEKMGWIKTKLPMYSSKSKQPMALNAADSPEGAISGSGSGARGFAMPSVPPYGDNDDDSNSGSGIRSPAPGSSTSTSKAHTPLMQPSYRPKIPIKERMEKLPEEGRKMYEMLFALKNYVDADARNVSAAFHKLPNRLELPSYYEVIKKPLDFARIQQKLTCQYYRSPADLIADFKLMFDNACKYNEPESQIYKDAITMQRVLLEKKREFFARAGGQHAFSAQAEIKSLLVTIFVAVFNKKDDEGRCHSDSFVDLIELMRARSIPDADFPFSFEQIKRNIDKGRYRRLDRLQSDFFALFSTARRVARSDSTLFEDAAALQKEFIRVRDETCKAVLHSNAYTALGKDIAESIEAERKAKIAEENEQEKREEERGRENEPGQVNGTSAKDEQLSSVTVKDIEYRDGDYALVSPSEKEVKEPHLMRIERMWKDGEGATLITGIWYFRPHETYHLATKKFADNEVFLTNFRDTVTSDRLMTKAAIVHPKQWAKCSVKGFDPENVFVCEERYLGKQLHFKKIKNWPFPADEDAFEMEERPTALVLTRTPREIGKGSNGVREDDESSQSSQSSQESAEEDERCSGVTVLDVDRPEVPLGAPDADGRTYFQQMRDKVGRTFFLGNHVLVFNHLKPFCDVMRVDKLWREADGAEFFSGGWFARPADLYHDLSHLFFRSEVFAVVQSDQTHRLEEVQAKCAVLPLKQFVKERPTEVPECDVFVCECRITGHLDEASTSNGTGSATPSASDCSLFVGAVSQEKSVPPMHVSSAAKFSKLKSYNLPVEVIEEEIFIFRQPIANMEKEPSPVLMKAAIEDLEMDESVAVEKEDPTKSAEANELVQWLSHQPKLNAKSKSGYILFSAEIRKRIMAENPDAGFGEVSKIVGVEWKKLTEDQKKQYEVRAEYIASERAKQDAANIAAGKGAQMTPGHVRVYLCRWTNCDFQFDCAEGLAEHVILYHTSQIIVDSENQYVCMWMSCMRNRKEGKPFPSLPRLHRHIREKHVGGSVKSMAPNGRSRNYFKFVPCGPAENGGVAQGGQLVQYPYGMHPSQAPPGALIAGPGGQPGIHPSGPQGMPQGMMNGHHHGGMQQEHHLQQHQVHGTPVRIVNGIDPRYQQSPAGPMQHGAPHGHNYAAAMPQTSQQAAHHPGAPLHHPGHHGPPPQQHHPGMAPPPQPGHHHPAHPQQMQPPGPMADARTVVTLARSNVVEPVFVPPPSSVHTRRVLHSETYLRYIESLSNARQRSVSQFDRSLRAHPRNTPTNNPGRLPANWLRESRGGQPVKEEEVVRALWRLREELLESTVDMERDYSGVL